MLFSFKQSDNLEPDEIKTNAEDLFILQWTLNVCRSILSSRNVDFVSLSTL